MTETIRVAYDASLLKWRLGKGHPTNPVRARNALNLLTKSGAPLDVRAISRDAIAADLCAVHDLDYVKRTNAGWNDEWQGERKDLARVARRMFQGTVDLVEGIIDGDVRFGFSPQGAKHHAMRDRGSGFCVYNDFAYAALRLADAGHRVLYVDTDAHHGDGVEALTAHEPDVMTCSIHDSSIFPGTGNADVEESNVFNWPLARGAGDRELLRSVYEVLALAVDFDPTVVLFAIGGDGYVADPLSSLEYTYAGYAAAAHAIGGYVGSRDLPILMGGAGGYLPHTHTPAIWANVVKGVYDASVHFDADVIRSDYTATKETA